MYTVSNSGGAFRRGVFRAASKAVSTSSGPASAVGSPTLGYDRVSGPERAKFFKRPVLPHLQAERPEVLLAPPPPSSNNKNNSPTNRRQLLRDASVEFGAGTRSVGVQTVYRDSEAQTDPYTPDYTIKAPSSSSSQTPEIVTLAHLKHREGQLPAGLAEVELVERSRKKRAFEAALPPMTDEASFLLRKRMLEAQETREWAYREDEIDALHAQRVTLLRQALAARDQEHAFLAEQRMDALRQSLVHELENARERIQQQRVAALRKLTKKRQQQQRAVEQLGEAAPQSQASSALSSSSKRDIIGKYADFGSRVYAPVTRNGKTGITGSSLTSKNSNVREAGIDTRAFRELDTLRELAAAVPARLLAPAALKPAEKKAPLTSKDPKQAAVEAHLLKMEALLKNKERQAEEDAAAAAGGPPASSGAASPAGRRSSLSLLHHGQQQAIVRPPTPDYALAARCLCHDGVDEDEDEDVAEAARLLQKLVRGRAVQNMMFDGRERRAELLAELRASDVAARSDTAAAIGLSASEGGANGMDTERRVAESTRRRAEGEVVSELLDALSKALDRSREVERLRAFVGQAVGVRREREVEEGGRRQAEELVREREDEVFRALSRVHLETAGDLVDDALAGVVAREAHAQAMRELQVRREGGIERLVATLESELDADDAVVRELVASFLLPQVQREGVRRQVAKEQRKFVSAAHALLQEAVVAAAFGRTDDADAGKEEDENEQ